MIGFNILDLFLEVEDLLLPTFLTDDPLLVLRRENGEHVFDHVLVGRHNVQALFFVVLRTRHSISLFHYFLQMVLGIDPLDEMLLTLHFRLVVLVIILDTRHIVPY